MKRLGVFALALLLLTSSLAAATNDNDDSCDISDLPAATLLLPFFEVDQRVPSAKLAMKSVPVFRPRNRRKFEAAR